MYLFNEKTGLIECRLNNYGIRVSETLNRIENTLRKKIRITNHINL
jgi:hypothetical protein